MRYKENGATNKGDIKIGNDVWIGMDVVVLSGVTINDGAVIAARTVVTKDVPPYAVVAGNPGRVKKKRFDEETIIKLLEIRWWDWPLEKIKANTHLLCSGEINKLIRDQNSSEKINLRIKK